MDLRQRGTAETIFSLSQIKQNQIGVTAVAAQNWSQCSSRVRNVRKRRDDERERGNYLFLDCWFPASAGTSLPRRLHGKRILAHRNADSELRTQFERNRTHG